MAIVTREITRHLTEATEKRSIPALKEAFHTLEQLMEKSVVVDFGKTMQAPNDLYLFCCEAAVSLEEWAIAKHCAERLVEGTTTSKAYQIRTLYCRAAIDVEATRSFRGKELIVGIQSALAKVVLGMKSALQDLSLLSHLVAIGTKHLWNIGRSLFKEGTFGDIVSVFGFAVTSLEKIEYQDWNVRIIWLLRYATALAGSSKLAEANAALQKAYDITVKYVPSLKVAVYRMQIAMSKLVANPKVKQDATRGIMHAVFASQALFCGQAEGAAAEPELTGAYQELSPDFSIPASPTAAAPSPADTKAGAKGAAPSPAPPKKEEKQQQQSSAEDMTLKEEVFSELGLALALNGDLDRATECTKVAVKSRSLKARVFGEYTSSLIKAVRCGGMAVQSEANSNFMTPAMIADLVSSVRELDRTLESAQRVGDPLERNHLVQYGCVLVWNVSLPLLQSTTRSQIARCLQNAAKHLEDIKSNMGLLRTLLYHEAAITDVDSDYLNKASTKVEKALGTDYYADPEDQRVYCLLCPLDRFLILLKRKLDVRSNVYAKPDNPEDEALLIVEQARDASVLNRLPMLTRAVGLLTESEPPADFFIDTFSPATKVEQDVKGGKGKAPPAGKKGKQDDDDANAQKFDFALEAKRNQLRVRANLWHMVMKSAWRESAVSMVTLARQAANALLVRQWVRKGDRDMRQLQAEAHFVLAETAVVELAAKGAYVAQRKFLDSQNDADDDDDEGDEGEEADTESSSAAKKQQQGKSKNGGPSLSSALDEQALLDRAAQLSTSVEATEAIIIENVVGAAKIGLELTQQGFDDQWIVANAATLLWNAHTRSMQENDFLAPLAAFEVVYSMLLAAQLDPKKETGLIRDTAFAYAQGLVQQYVRDKLAADPASANLSANALAIQASRVTFASYNKTEPNNAKLLKAWEVCDKMIATLPTPMDAKEFLMMSASIQRLLGRPMDQRSHPQQRLLIILEQLKQPLTVDEKRNLIINTALDLLTQDPNVELCARLAASSLQIPDNDRTTVRITTIGSQLYADGRLGWKQNDLAAAPAAAGKGAKGASKADATNNAAAIAAADASKPVDIPPPSPEDWYWYSLLLQYEGIAMSQLVNPVLQEKPTQWEIRSRALNSITNSAMAAIQGVPEYRGEAIRKAIRIYHDICHELSTDMIARGYAVQSIRQLVHERILKHATLGTTSSSASVASDVEVLAELFVLYLMCLHDIGEVDEGLQALKTAMKFLPAALHKPFWGFDIQLRCAADLPTNQTLLRVKEYAPETQSQVWVVFSKYAKTVEDQRFALQNAVDVLSGKPAEQAAHMLLFAQWMLSTNYGVTLDVVVDLVMSAVDLVGSSIDAEPEEDISSEAASSAGGGGAASQARTASVGKSLGGTMTTMGNTKSKAGTVATKSVASFGYAKKRADRSRASIKMLKVALEAYYILARICGYEQPADNTSNSFTASFVDARCALGMIVHYALRIISTTVASANAHNHKLKAKALKAQRLAMANGGSVTVDPSSIPDDVEIPAAAHAWIGFAFPPSFAKTLRSMKTPSAISASTVEDVDTFIAVLEDVVDMLCREGLELQAHPILNLMKLLIEVCQPIDDSVTTVSLHDVNSKLFQTALDAGIGSLAVAYRVTDPYLTVNEVLALHENARILSERNATAVADPAKAVTPRKKDKATNGAPQSMVQLREVKPGSIHKYWASLSRSMLLEGRFVSAQQIAELAASHAKANNDIAVSAKCAWIMSQIAFLEGKADEALEGIQHALAEFGSVVNAHMWVEMKLFELECLLKLQRLEDAIRGAGVSAGILGTQSVFCTGLAKDVALRVVPELECILLMRFASMAIRALTENNFCDDINQRRVQLSSILQRAIDCASSVPNLRAQKNLLQVELSRLDATIHDSNASLLNKKLRLCREARWLSDAVQASRDQLATSAGMESDSVSLATCPTPLLRVSATLCALGQNLLERVELNAKLLKSFRESNFTTLQYPLVAGAPETLEGHVVYFMRSSRKQRAADVRKAQRREQAAEIERQRSLLRQEKQRDIDKRREQRKQELEGLLKKDPKAKPSAKVAAALNVDEPDVDPLDKCGIMSPGGSDDEGHGEDSQSDEEEELRLALRELPADDVELEVRVSYANAVECFAAASESSFESTPANLEAKIGQATALLRSYEAVTLGTEQREGMLRGEKPTNTTRSRSVAFRWNKPFDLVVEEETGKSKKLAEAKKPPPKGAKDAPIAAAATTPADPKKLAEALVLGTFTNMLEVVIRQAHAINDLSQLERAHAVYAEAMVLQGQCQAAGLAIESTQAYASAKYVFDVWRASAHADAAEVALYNAVEYIRREHPAAVHSPHFNEMLKAFTSTCKMASRIKVPLCSWGQPNVNDVTPFSQDVCVLTIARASGADNNRWLLAFRRPAGVIDVRDAEMDMAKLDDARRELASLEAVRGSILAVEHIDAALLAAQNKKVKSAVDSINTILSALWQPWQSLIENVAAKNHLVLCVDPSLAALPLEWCPELSRFRSIQRDLSVFSVASKLQRRNTERYVGTAAGIIVDPRRDAPGSVVAVLGDEKPKIAGWQLLTAALDENKQYRFPGVAQVQRFLTTASFSSIIVSAVGRFTSLFPMHSLATLSLEHVRVMILMDRASREVASRRENQSDMCKTARQLWAEQPWNTAMLLLARGVEFVTVNHYSAAMCVNELLCRTALSNMDKPQARSFAEAIAQVLRKIMEDEQQTAASTTGKPFDITPTSVDCFNVAFYGLSFDEPIKIGK